MIDECIHGLDRDRCDVCSPKVAPPVVAPAKSAPRTASRSAPKTSTRRQAPRAAAATSAAPRRAAGTSSKSPTVNIGAQRLHHITHVSNLAAIIASGGLQAGVQPPVDISASDNRDVRRATPVAGPDSASVADYVPFFLSPNARLWEGIRAGSGDPRFSPATTGRAASEFVILVTTVGTQPAADVVVADGDAADPRTRFGASVEAWERMLRRVVTDQDSDSLLLAEFLVKDVVPFEAVSVIGVANDRARDAVRELLAASSHSPRIAVHPPWFALPEASTT